MEPTTCTQCQQPIDEQSVYFWGRDGGQWHAHCLQTLKGYAIRGMWLGGQDEQDRNRQIELAFHGLSSGAGI